MLVTPYDDAPRLPEGERVDPRELLGGVDAFELEIGPGRGWFMVERCEADPRVRIVGFEVRRKWATIVDRRLASRGFGERARVFAEDAKLALPRLPDGCVSVAYFHFPDPWWKKRHAKRLVIVEPTMEQIARVLRPGGELFIQTDVEERAEQYERVVGGFPIFRPAGAGQGARLSENPYEARSPRERRAIEDGLPVVRLRYRRDPA